MFAVIATGGKQYKVSEGDLIRVEKLDSEVGAKLVMDKVLMVGGERIQIGRPFLGGIAVEAEVMAQDRAKKIVVFKMKHRKNLRRKQGHRQPFTELKITKIIG
ncbi:MAG: 50S ribosomal protein L21 [Myxococcota bacterium]|jgi:large subunit ribosomal protein L21|nr:50S ribosomal protein L21 [Myxococcota bacterium]